MKPWSHRQEVACSLREDGKKFIGSKGVDPTGRKTAVLNKVVRPGDEKLCEGISDAIIKSGLKDGMTVSFHHHFRGGDYILNNVMDEIAKMGYKDITIASSSLSSVHAPLIKHIESGVITKIHTSGLRGELAQAISAGLMDEPVVIRSHGGRARAIESGDLKIDVAFLGVSSSDAYGNANGMFGDTICGSLGYALVDAEYADQVVVITDQLADYPNMPASITQQQVDFVVSVEQIGDPNKISTGATRFTKNPKDLLIAKKAAEVIQASEYFREGFSFQTGSGGAALAVSRFLKDHMDTRGIKARFALGGITEPMVALHEAGYIEHLFDVQCFDLAAAQSIGKNKNHHEITASQYANPHTKGSVTNKLDIVILSALEIDKAFNVNVMTASDGVLMGASGGHSDTAACAKMTVIVAPLIRGRIPTVVDQVQTVITPGSSVDVLVTDRGIAVHPDRTDLQEAFAKAGIETVTVEALIQKAKDIVGEPAEIPYSDKVIGVVEYRDGTWMDVIYGVERSGDTNS